MAGRKSTPLGHKPILGRLIRFVVLTLGMLLVAAIAAVWYFGPKASLAFVLRQGLTLAGYGPVALEVTRLDGGALVLENFSAGRGGALLMRKASLNFKDGGPLAGAQALVVDGLIYAASVGPGGFDSGFALGPSSGSSSFGLPDLPFPVIVNDARARLDTPFGFFDVVSSSATRLEAGGLSSAYDLSFSPGGEKPGGVAAHRGVLAFTSDASGLVDFNLTFAPGAAPNVAGGVKARSGSGAPAASASPSVSKSSKGGTFDLRVTAKGNFKTGPFEAQAALSNVNLPAFDLVLSRATVQVLRADAVSDYAVSAALDDLRAFDTQLAHAALEGAVAQQGGAYRLRAPGCGRIENVTFNTLPTPLRANFPKLCGTIDKDILATLEGGKLDFGLQLLDAVVSDGVNGKPPGFEGTLPEIRLTGASGHGAWHAQLIGYGGDLHGLDAKFVFNDIVIEGDISGAGAAGKPKGRFAVTHLLLSDMETPARFSHVAFKGEVKLADAALAFELSGAMLPAIERLAGVSGTHALATGIGEAHFDLPRLEFAPGGLQPGALSPALGAQLSEAVGSLEATGSFAWTPQGIASSGAFKIADLGMRTPFGGIAGMNGDVAFASLVPPETRESQTLTIKMLDVGLPLPDGEIKFRMLPEGRLVVERAKWPVMGGTIGLSSAIFDFARAENTATLAVDGIDLAQLLVAVDVDGLSGTGTLNGRIPIRFDGTHQYLEGGKVAAEPPGGTLIYKSVTGEAAAGAADQSKILFQALDNFQYQALDATLNGDLAGDLSLKVHLKGHNPALYEGYPIELNVNTDGPFVAMVKKSLFDVNDVTQPR